jgi:hypothetical protein
MQERRRELPFVRWLDESSRLYPTSLHQAAASLGSWIGGATNIQYLSQFATRPQIADPAVNIEFAVSRLGFTEGFAREMDSSGLIAIPDKLAVALFETQGSRTLGTISPDEANVANMPQLADRLVNDIRDGGSGVSGYIFDKYYRVPFTAHGPDASALMGGRTIYRDHYSEFYAALGDRPALRCKHYSIPIIEVSSTEQIASWIARIPERSENGIFLRGQARSYMLERSPRVKRLLFGDSCSDEPSLCSSAARLKFDYDKLHHCLRYYVDNHVLPPSNGPRADAYSPLCRFDYAIMALAQHYGLPSHGLDVTSSLDVAVWFATNRLVIGEERRAHYERMAPESWSADPGTWPVVFAIQTVSSTLSGSVRDCALLNEWGLQTLRPDRQRAKFLLGGHSDHQNRLAEAVVCAFRLAPDRYGVSVSFEELFPSPEEDPAYRAMLKFEEFRPVEQIGPYRVMRFHRSPDRT